METSIAGQQDMSNLRHDLTQFHRLAELKLERDTKTLSVSAVLVRVRGLFISNLNSGGRGKNGRGSGKLPIIIAFTYGGFA